MSRVRPHGPLSLPVVQQLREAAALHHEARLSAAGHDLRTGHGERSAQSASDGFRNMMNGVKTHRRHWRMIPNKSLGGSLKVALSSNATQNGGFSILVLVKEQWAEGRSQLWCSCHARRRKCVFPFAVVPGREVRVADGRTGGARRLGRLGGVGRVQPLVRSRSSFPLPEM